MLIERARKILLKAFCMSLFVILYTVGVEARPHHGGSNLSLMDAVKLTLKLQPNIKIAQEDIVDKKGALLLQSAIFVPTLNPLLSYQYTTTPTLPATRDLDISTHDIAQTITSSLIFSRTFRWGMIVSPQLVLTHANTQAHPGSLTPYGNTAGVLLSITQPLLKNAGFDIVQAPEKQAKYDILDKSTTFDYIVSQQISGTVTAYWNYFAAIASKEAWTMGLRRAQHLKKAMLKYFHARHLTDAEMNQFESLISERHTQLLKSQLVVFQMQQLLALAMGIEVEQLLDNMGKPTENAPKVSVHQLNKPQQKKMIEYALQHRHDLKSLTHQVDSKKTAMLAARKNVKPELDFTATIGYTGLKTGQGIWDYFNAVGHGIAGVNGMVSLEMQLPFSLTNQRGVAKQARAALNKVIYQMKAQQRQVVVDVSVAYQNYFNTSKVLAQSQKTVKNLRATVNALLWSLDGKKVNVNKLHDMVAKSTTSKTAPAVATIAPTPLKKIVTKTQRYDSALIPTIIAGWISTEERYQASLMDEIAAQQSYANAIVDLRFKSATMLDEKDSSYHIELKHLTTFPKRLMNE